MGGNTLGLFWGRTGLHPLKSLFPWSLRMVLTVIRIILGILTAASIGYFIFSILAARRFFSAASPPPSVNYAPVSIMIPLCGADFKAYENYASICRQQYPEFQMVFGVRDAQDSSVDLVRQLEADFPQIPIDLVVSGEEIGPNPKVNNLNNMLPHTRHDIIVLLDSDIRLGPDFLKTVIAELLQNPDGAVTCLYRAGEAPGIPSTLEAIGISAEFAPGVLVANAGGGISFAFGAAIAIGKETFEAIGGFPAIAAHLADDYMIGNLVRKAGHPVGLSRYVVETVLSRLTIGEFFRHQVRWSRGIRACNPWGHTGSIITNGTVLGLLYLIFSGFSAFGWAVFLAAIVMRFAMAKAVGIHTLRDEILRRNLHLLPLRDLFSFLIWCTALFGKTVEWRGKKFRLDKSGTMVPANPR